MGFALRRIPYNDMRVELNLGNGRGNPGIPGLECKIQWKMVANCLSILYGHQTSLSNVSI